MIYHVLLCIRHESKTGKKITGWQCSEMQLQEYCGWQCSELCTIASRKLTIHHNQKRIPAAKRLDIFITLKFHYDTVERSFRKKLDELTENIFPFVHSNQYDIGCYLQIQINTLKNGWFLLIMRLLQLCVLTLSGH